MRRTLSAIAFCIAACTVAGCVYYEPVAVGPSLEQRFDRSWSAALAAMADQGVAIDAQDRGAGVIRGNRGGIVLTATLQTLADGSIKVQFDQSGATTADPGLIHRVSASYDRRMGR